MRNLLVSLSLLSVFFLQITHHYHFSYPVTDSRAVVKQYEDLAVDFYQSASEVAHQVNNIITASDYVVFENDWQLRTKEFFNRASAYLFIQFWQLHLFELLFPFHVFI